MATEEVAMAYPPGAVERAMKVQEVIVRALDGKLTWLQAADILGRSPRSIRRLRWRLEHYGYDGLVDRRRQTPSPKRAPVAEVERMLHLYRAHYQGFNVRHFLRKARRDHGIPFCYAFVKQALQGAGLVPKHRARGRHRRRREPRPCFGELLHLDGSRHQWLALVPEQWLTLLAVVDDATPQVLYAQLSERGESTVTVMTALRTVFTTWGLPGALYTDRAHWAAHTPVAGGAVDRTKLSQVGRALVPLGGVDLEQILCHQDERVVARDNTVVLDGIVLQLAKQPGRRSCAELRGLVRRHLDGHHSVWHGARRLGLFDARGRVVTPAAA